MRNWRWLSSYIRPIRFPYLLSIALEMLSALAAIGMILLQKTVVDDIFIGEKHEWFIPVVSLFFIVVTVYFLAHAYAYILAQKCTLSIRYRISMDLLRYLRNIPLRVFRKERVARYSQYFTNETQSTAGFAGYRALHGAVDAMKALVLAGVIGYFSWTLLVFIVCCSALFVWQVRVFGPKLKQISKEIHHYDAEFKVTLEESLSSTREVIAYHRGDWEAKRLNRSFMNYYRKMMQQGNLANKQSFVSEPLRWGTQIAVLGYTGYGVIQGTMSIGMLVILYQLSVQLLEAIHAVYDFAGQAAGQSAVIERLRNLLEGEQDSEHGEPLSGAVRSMQWRNVSFRYDEHSVPVLNEVTFDIEQGRRIAFVGLSGAGKSTIVDLLARTHDPGSGVILVNGTPLHRIQRSSWAKRTAFVFQEPFFFPASIRENLTMGDERIEFDDVIEACKAACIHDYIAALPDGYDTVLGERGINLSGGQKQRLSIARAIVRKPEFLVLDEATSSLDQDTEKQVQDNLARLYPTMTQLVIAHRLITVTNADRIHVLDKGAIVESGTYDELEASDSYFRRLIDAERTLARDAG